MRPAPLSEAARSTTLSLGRTSRKRGVQRSRRNVMSLSALRRTGRVLVGGIAISLLAVAVPADAHAAPPTPSRPEPDVVGEDRPPQAGHTDPVVEPVRLE